MNKLFSTLLLGLIFAFNLGLGQAQILAHGGVSNQAGEYILFLNQTPLSPFVKEPVELNFALKNLGFEALPGKSIKLNLIEIKDNDPANDEKVATLDFISDVNGSFAFIYAFPKASYYDLEVTITDDYSDPVTIGFLVQVRNVKSDPLITYGLVLIGVLSLFTLIFQKNKLK